MKNRAGVHALVVALIVAVLAPLGAMVATADHASTITYLVPAFDDGGQPCCHQARHWSFTDGAELRVGPGPHPLGGSALGLVEPAGGAAAAAVMDRADSGGQHPDALEAFDDMSYWSRREAHSGGPSNAQVVLNIAFEKRPLTGPPVPHVATFVPRLSAWAPEAANGGVWQRFTTTGSRGVQEVRGWVVSPPLHGSCTTSATCSWAQIVEKGGPTARITSLSLSTPDGPDEFWGGVDGFAYTYREPLVNGGVRFGPGGPQPYTETREVFHYVADFDARQPEGTVDIFVRRPGEATLATAGTASASHVNGPSLPGVARRGDGTLALDATGATSHAALLVDQLPAWQARSVDAVIHRQSTSSAGTSPVVEVAVAGHPDGPATLRYSPPVTDDTFVAVSAPMMASPLTPAWTIDAAIGGLSTGTTYTWKQLLNALAHDSSPGAVSVVVHGDAAGTLAGGVDVASITHLRTVGIDLEPAPPATTTSTTSTSTTSTSTTSTSTTTTTPPTTSTSTTTTIAPTTTTSTTSTTTTVPATTTTSTSTTSSTTTTTVPGGGGVKVTADNSDVTLLGSYERLRGDVRSQTDNTPVPGVWVEFYADRDGNGTYETLLCANVTGALGSASCTSDLYKVTLTGHGIAAYMPTQRAADGRVWTSNHGLARANLVITPLTFR